MMAISDSWAYAEPLVNELFMQVVCGNALVAIFTNALRQSNINDIQTALFWIKRGLSHSECHCRHHNQQEQKSSVVFYVHFVLSDNFSSVLDKDAAPWHFNLSALEVVGRDGRRV